MLIVMNNNATQADVEQLCEKIKSLGFLPYTVPGAVWITGDNSPISSQQLVGMKGVREVIPVTKPHKLTTREHKAENTIINVNGTKIGEDFLVIAGPCSVESLDTTMRIAEQLKQMGLTFFRAGAFKPRTSPYQFQGLGLAGLDILAEVKNKLGLSIVTEVLDIESLAAVAEIADIVQLGTRNMANTSLLKAVGKINQPVLLKRGMSATLDEYLLAAEYIMAHGNPQVILCERGIRTFGNHSRSTLDIAAIPVLQQRTHLPVFVDPSHAGGVTSLVAPLSLAAVAAGAQGLLIEVHDDAAKAYSDGQQALHPQDLKKLLPQFNAIRMSIPIVLHDAK